MKLKNSIYYRISKYIEKTFATSKDNLERASDKSYPWYPSKEEDLNLIGHQLLNVKDDFGNDHMQFIDP